ncbi:hypothetical protein [Opitutus terrae]|uniref:Uncharacterized protein n=1 Tax=Opitutus terrae (strain DSM 11246 / JCM 15787 / PB90-1) TaxID=452637 RepID=B1ZUR5_OPITP|nr:hypothetical protein [Opitutus terrae]ACB74949.1 conserved hypothetical protein [Opitutus terrae PB90-1]
MNWILEHFQIVVALVAALAYYLTKAKRSDGEEPEREVDRRPSEAEREQAERTRRIQEEIRRKIAERRGAAGDVITAEPRPDLMPPALEPAAGIPPVDTFGGPAGRLRRELEKAAERRSSETDEARARAAEIERQTRLAEQLRTLQAKRAAEERWAEEIAATAKAAANRRLLARAAQATTVTGWQARLRNREELRRAIVLREVLGPPVGMR